MTNRLTGKPCPCGSGKPGKRTLRFNCTSYIACPDCVVNEGGRSYRDYVGEDAKRQAKARRALEARREMKGVGE